MEPSGTREQTLADYLAVVRRYKWLIILAAIIVPLAAYAMSARQPKVFRATSEVLLNQQDLGSELTGIPTANTVSDPDRYARTQAALARMPAVALGAIQRAGVKGMEPWQLVGSADVSPRGDTDLLIFAVKNGDRQKATQLAAAYAEAFVAYKLQMDTTSLSQARRELQTRLLELRREGAVDTDTYRELVRKSQDLRTLEILQVAATVVRTPTNANQVAPAPTRNAMMGLLLGLVLGIGGAFVINAFDRRVRDADEVERALQIPLLARLPAPPRSNDMLTILDRPPDAVTEAAGRLRTSFDFANSDLQAKLVMATSAGAGEGKSTTLANLAIALSRTGRRVVLIDLDLRRPSITRLFHLPSRPGLTDVATGNAELAAVLTPIVPVPIRSRLVARGDAGESSGLLEVVTAGLTRVDAAQFVETSGLAEVLRRLRDRADVVLVDAPPILATGDAMALTGKMDAILLVNRLGTLTRPALSELARALSRSPAPVLGFVATGAQLDESYSVYRAEETEYAADNAARSLEIPTLAPTPEAPPARRASAGGGRWTPGSS